MTDVDIRNWPGKYFLGITLVIGGYILLFAETKALPGLSRDQAWKVFQIIVPVLVGQLTIIFRWFGNGQRAQPAEAKVTGIPEWVVKGPPLLTSGFLVLMVALMVVGNNRENPWGPAADSVSALVTFVVTVLNATTLFVVAGFFEANKETVASTISSAQSESASPSPAAESEDKTLRNR
jgi:hypothetical protein